MNEAEHGSYGDKVIKEVKDKALEFFLDNKQPVLDLNYIETAMLIGVAIAMSLDEGAIQLEAWQSAFGTNQLTHALARLQTAERIARQNPDSRQGWPSGPVTY